MDSDRAEMLETAAKLDALVSVLLETTGRACILRDQLREAAGKCACGANNGQKSQGDTNARYQTFSG